jgi:23S rRNA (uridine2552-2'-O)-methyltransferase
MHKGDVVLDLGCAPGSWMLFAAETVGKNGRVIGIDLKPVTIKIPSNITVYTGDILEMNDKCPELTGHAVNVLVSDMAPATTGMKQVDAARSLNLCESALEIALACLASGGNFVCKIFQGPDFKSFTERMRTYFKIIKIFKPESCRKASKEIYIIGLDKRQEDFYGRS